MKRRVATNVICKQGNLPRSGSLIIASKEMSVCAMIFVKIWEYLPPRPSCFLVCSTFLFFGVANMHTTSVRMDWMPWQEEDEVTEEHQTSILAYIEEKISYFCLLPKIVFSESNSWNWFIATAVYIIMKTVKKNQQYFKRKFGAYNALTSVPSSRSILSLFSQGEELDPHHSAPQKL